MAADLILSETPLEREPEVDAIPLKKRLPELKLLRRWLVFSFGLSAKREYPLSQTKMVRILENPLSRRTLTRTNAGSKDLF